MISAGLIMGFIGYLVTFIVLAILAAIIWAISRAVLPPKLVPTIPHEIIAAAVAAVKAHISSKKPRITPTPRPKYSKWRNLGWLRSARLSHMETLEEYEAERRRKRK